MLSNKHQIKKGVKMALIQIVVTDEEKERLQIFAKKIVHHSTLAGWMRSLAFSSIDESSEDQKQKLNDLLGG